MNDSVFDRELLRCRWRRARRALHLLDPHAETFATGGLANKLDDPSVRLLILPADPDRHDLRFDAVQWKFFLEDRPEPATGLASRWEGHGPTESAMVRFDPIYDGTDRWRRYLALDRSGGLELGLGSCGAFELRGHRTFALIPIVARVWAALDLYD